MRISTLLAALALPTSAAAAQAHRAEPLVIGETFTMESAVLGETRRITVYRTAAAPDGAHPVLYMPDGGIGEDFLHVAGLVQVLTGNGGMRPFLLVGIENTERRRDLTGPTENAEDREIAPRVGGSAAFRSFLRDELMPEVRRRYPTTDETAIVGESLAGLFVVETFLLEPDLFDTWIAFDPSLWWNDGRLVEGAAARLATRDRPSGTLYLATSSQDIAAQTQRLAQILEADSQPGLRWEYHPMPEETHATIYHPAALKAFRTLLAPVK